MKYYRVDIGNYKIGISCGNDIPTKEFLNDRIYEFLKSQREHINGNVTFDFKDSNEKEFEDLKHQVRLDLK